MEKQEKTRYMAKLWTGAGKQWKVESKTQLFQYWEKYKGKMTAIGRSTCLCTTNFLNFYIWTFFCKIKGCISQQYSEMKNYYLYGENWSSEWLKSWVRKVFISVLVFVVNGSYKLHTCFELNPDYNSLFSSLK